MFIYNMITTPDNLFASRQIQAGYDFYYRLVDSGDGMVDREFYFPDSRYVGILIPWVTQ